MHRLLQVLGDCTCLPSSNTWRTGKHSRKLTCCCRRSTATSTSGRLSNPAARRAVACSARCLTASAASSRWAASAARSTSASCTDGKLSTTRALFAYGCHDSNECPKAGHHAAVGQHLVQKGRCTASAKCGVQKHAEPP